MTILTGVVIRQRLFLKVPEKIWPELPLQPVTVKPEHTLDTIPNKKTTRKGFSYENKI
jgi:hypothetical protein